MSSFLVLPFQHHLLPLAWTLRSEKHTIEVIPQRDRFERAWEGLFDKVLTLGDKRNPRNLEPVVKLAEAGKLAVLTDSPKWQSMFAGAELLFGSSDLDVPYDLSPVEIGGFIHSGVVYFPHLLVRDVGTHPGGLGDQVTTSAMALWFDSESNGLLEKLPDEFHPQALIDADFNGLFRAKVDLSMKGELEVSGLQTGWDLFQTQLFIAHIEEGLGDWLTVGTLPTPSYGRYTSALAVWVPPWPHEGSRSGKVTISGLTTEQRKTVGWLDVCVNSGEMQTAQLDGLVGVVRGHGNTPQWSMGQALDVAYSLELEEKMFRADAGSAFGAALALLDRFRLIS